MAGKAAAAPRKTFRCEGCGHAESRWLGRCPGCGQWNSMIEEGLAGAARAAAPVSAALVEAAEAAPRRSTGIGEMDRVLGGGPVPGALVLLGGDPGIGKSTLLLQTLDGLARRGARVVYASGEESVAQVGLRARRLGVTARELLLCSETNLENVLAEVERLQPQVL